jgi:hypothetical protein
MEKALRKFVGSTSRNDMSGVNTELHSVQRIMEKNIEDVLQRGTHLDALDSKAQKMRENSKKSVNVGCSPSSSPRSIARLRTTNWRQTKPPTKTYV